MELPAYSGVVIFAGQDDEGNNIEYRAGDQTGTLLEITNEWGSQAQADAIYKKIRGHRYQPYKASGTRIDPSVEIGDAVTIADTYGGVFLRETTYGRDITSELEAPSKEEIEHEFQIQSPTNRQYERFTRSVRASLTITATKIAAEVEAREAADEAIRATLSVQADAIEARVTKEGGNSSSFGWKLLNNSWTVSGNGKNIFTVDRNGAKVEGEIRATSGKIGGFDIQKDYLSYNGQTWGGTNTWGCYIGSSGIQLGKNFKVDMSGNLTASSGRFEGTVYAGNIDYGGSAGYFSGGGLSGGSVGAGKIVGNSLGTGQFAGGVNTSLGYADFANGVFNGWNTAPSLSTEDKGLVIGGHRVAVASTSFRDGTGGTVSLRYLTWLN
jgi:hypothetical protein|nr:MAG TPA: hypothetical protein [Caudoviricetes sp.]